MTTSEKESAFGKLEAYQFCYSIKCKEDCVKIESGQVDKGRSINILSTILKESQLHAVRGIPPKKCKLERADCTSSFYTIYQTTLGVSLIPGSHFSLVFSLHL